MNFTMTPEEQFRTSVTANVQRMGNDVDLLNLSREWIRKTGEYNYAYNFSWLGRPIIQLPQDIVAMQEIIWQVRPDLIVETGIAHGGSLIFSATVLAMLDYCEAAQQGIPLNPAESKRTVVGVDIDIREHNRKALEEHPLSGHIRLIEGSSLDADVVDKVHQIAATKESVLVCLDSNHTHAHVLEELKAYGPLVTPNSYCVVFDTLIDDMPDELWGEKEWGKGNNPKTAVKQFLVEHPEFSVDETVENKTILTAAPHGFLRRSA